MPVLPSKPTLTARYRTALNQTFEPMAQGDERARGLRDVVGEFLFLRNFSREFNCRQYYLSRHSVPGLSW